MVLLLFVPFLNLFPSGHCFFVFFVFDKSSMKGEEKKHIPGCFVAESYRDDLLLSNMNTQSILHKSKNQ